MSARPSLGSPLDRAIWILVAGGLAVMVAAVLHFTVGTVAVRVPYWGEAEVLFDASRLRAHLPLFVDPFLGARDLGEPPSRWYVTYPPIWAFALSLVPAGSALVVGRLLSSLAWFGSLLAMGFVSRRRAALACGAYVAGSWVLANFATVARPDSIACALAAWGLARALRRGRIDTLSAVLLAAAPWVKPTLIGLPLGAFAGDLARRRAWPPIAVAAATTLALGVFFHLVSGGALLGDIVRSNAQPFTFGAWLEHVPSRLPFFAPVIGFGGFVAWRSRSLLGGGALVGATLWTLVALAKIGSASNYWMEPCIAAVAVVAFAPMAAPFVPRRRHAALALAAVAYAGVASVRGSFGHREEYRDDAAFVAHVRDLCSGVVASDEAGIELALEGRIIVPTYQFSYLVAAGNWPASIWAADIAKTGCYVEHTGQLPAEVRQALSWRLLETHGRYRVFSARAP